MTRADKKLLGLIIGGVLLASVTAAVASYTTYESLQPKTDEVQRHVARDEKRGHEQQHAQNAQPACNDNNVVGTLAGGVGGGVLGSEIGRGAGKTAATIAGTMGGAYLGNQYIPTRNVTCRQ